MTFSLECVARAVVIGLGATLVTDLWNQFLKRAFGIASLNMCLLGRWILHFRNGVFAHAKISDAASKRIECALGWIAHYSIGAALSIGFVGLVSCAWLAAPTALPALAYGLCTVVFPYFILQPALGLGMASSKARNPMQARLKSLGTHFAFGVGLYACALFAG